MWDHYELSELYLKKEKAEKYVEEFKKKYLKENPGTYHHSSFNFRKTEDRDIPIRITEMEVIE